MRSYPGAGGEEFTAAEQAYWRMGSGAVMSARWHDDPSGVEARRWRISSAGVV